MRSAIAPTFFLVLSTVLLGLPGAVRAQEQFGAPLSAIPLPCGTAIPGISGRATLSLDVASHTLFYRVETNLPALPTNDAHILLGSSCVGSVQFALAGGPTEWRGSQVLTAAQEHSLYAGDLFVRTRTSPVLLWPGLEGRITKTVRRHLGGGLCGACFFPPSPSPFTGTMSFVLHQPENVLTFDVSTNMVGPTVIVAELVYFGPSVIPIAPIGPGVASATGVKWCGTIGPLTQAQIDMLMSGSTFLIVRTTAFPGGEIGGPVAQAFENFVVKMDGAKAVPSAPTPATGFGKFTFDVNTKKLSFDASWTGALGMGLEIRIGEPDVSGLPIFPPFLPLSGPWIGITTPPLTPPQIDALFKYGLSVNVLSIPFPFGEIRGQIAANPDVFGYAGPTSAPPLGRILRSGEIGIPFLGNPAFGVTVCDALPLMPCSLGFAQDLTGTPLDLGTLLPPLSGHMMWANFISSYPATADANGCASLSFAVPASPTLQGAEVYFQWYSIDLAANFLGVVSSDALHVTLQ